MYMAMRKLTNMPSKQWRDDITTVPQWAFQTSCITTPSCSVCLHWNKPITRPQTNAGVTSGANHPDSIILIESTPSYSSALSSNLLQNSPNSSLVSTSACACNTSLFIDNYTAQAKHPHLVAPIALTLTKWYHTTSLTAHNITENVTPYCSLWAAMPCLSPSYSLTPQQPHTLSIMSTPLHDWPRHLVKFHCLVNHLTDVAVTIITV